MTASTVELERASRAPAYAEAQRVRLTIGRNATVCHIRQGGRKPSEQFKNTFTYCLWVDHWGEEWMEEQEIERVLSPGEADPEVDWWK